MIDGMFKNKLKQKTIKSIYPIIIVENNRKFTCITYLEKVSNKILTFINENSRLAFKTDNSLRKKIKNSKDKDK